MEIDKLLQVVIAQAKALKIPIAHNINPEVKINCRAKTRFGRCVKSPFSGCAIEVSECAVKAGDSAVKEILAHEILHSCCGCANHGERWKSFADKMNIAYGYHIKRTQSCEELGIIAANPMRYTLLCQSCGAELNRMKKSPLVLHPERYRCRCGGKLILQQK